MCLLLYHISTKSVNDKVPK